MKGVRFRYYTHSVVGGVVNCTGVIYGARIHRTVTLRLRVLMYVIVKYIGRWLYVVIKTKQKSATEHTVVVLANKFYIKTHVDK